MCASVPWGLSRTARFSEITGRHRSGHSTNGRPLLAPVRRRHGLILAQDLEGEASRDAGAALGRDARAHMRKEFVYGPYGPYAHRAPVVGRPIKFDLTAPVVSHTFSTAETDEEQEKAERARMCYEYEMQLRKFRRRIQQRMRMGARGGGTTRAHLPTGPISYFFAFVSGSPPPPASAKVWEAWSLVAQLAVEFPGGTEGMTEGLRPNQNLSGEIDQSFQYRGPGVYPGVLDKWELPGRMTGHAMNQVTRCVGWFRPDLLFVKRPCFELRLEPQQPFFEALAPLLQQEVLGLADPGHAAGVHASLCRALGLNWRRNPDPEQAAEAFANADAGTQSATLRVIFEAAMAAEENAQLLSAKAAPALRRDGASERRLSAVEGSPLESGEEGSPPGEASLEGGAELRPQAASFAAQDGLRKGTIAPHWSEEASVQGRVGPRRQAAGTMSQEDVQERLSTAAGEEEDHPSGPVEAALRESQEGRRKVNRIKLYGKEGKKGALGKGTWKVATSPYDYRRLVLEVFIIFAAVRDNYKAME